jgi:hypothetical protein
MLRTLLLAACFCALATLANAEVVGHPRGCPKRLFCGCGAAVKVFGKPVRSLWLARAWYRFPRARPGPGRVAVRRHHVFVLLRHVRGKIWLAWDANSGGGKTRIHPRSIVGFTVVDPQGSRMAWQ